MIVLWCEALSVASYSQRTLLPVERVHQFSLFLDAIIYDISGIGGRGGLVLRHDCHPGSFPQ
ncbi:hypothetical protein PISMIDRAFT_684316 [Pisolithus microcarpus 441]|uniref:Uncharacterized protein n=1 Tax=Pisolithus microcarpus 441 TaxID=765257 RepID=A0A0C9YNG1_9AGAM|nr:hypothetical protein PISMIDRAFT_684316 [Pisolithus microcarpus 441]